MSRFSNHHGFTLIELMIAVIIVGILSAMAMPSYLKSVQKSRRSDAQGALLEAAQKMEIFYAKGASYTTDLVDINVTSVSSEGYYTIAIATETADCPKVNCYSLTAVPISTGLQKNDDAKGFRISSLGLREMTYNGSTWVSGWK